MLLFSNLTPLDLSQARVDSIIDEKYTKNDCYEGQKGAAQVVYKVEPRCVQMHLVFINFV